MALPLDKIIQKAKFEGHSQEFISDINEYASNLQTKKMPVIFSTSHLALLIGIHPSILTSIIEDRQRFYKSYKLRKKNGGFRWISSPKNDLKYIQGWIKVNILDKIKNHKAVCGFKKGS